MKTTPYTGYKVRTYRNLYDANGKLISSTYEATSDYKVRNKVIARGPALPEDTTTSGTTELPETPTTPETPATPETPSTPETPTTPSTPETPQTPSQPETPEMPDAPVVVVPDLSGDSSAGA